MPAKARRTLVTGLCLAHALSALAPSRAEELPSPPRAPVVVTAPRVPDDYWPARERLGLTGRPLRETPASVTVVPRSLMDDQGARGVAGIIGNDASVGENYAPLGYYEALSIRGFTLDGASGYKRDGLTIANESSMPLENKERVEILKAVAGFETGLAAPGGAVNYVVKRPTDAPTRRVTLELSDRGTRYAHADLGGRFDGGRFGYRFNAARESLHPYVKEAVGRRDFLSAALDWRLGENAIFALDADWQKKSQLSVPGYQPLGGTVLPAGVRPETMLNNQPWSEPVAIEASNIGARFQYEAGDDWRFEAAVNRNRVASEDKAAFPYGCSSGPVYLNTFCANGDYDLYDYRSSGEIRTVTQARAVLSGGRDWGAVRHDATVGLSRFDRTVALGQEVYDFVGTDNIYAPRPSIFAPSPNATGVVHRNQDYTEQALFVQDSISWSSRWKLQAGLRASAVSDDRFRKLDGAPASSFRRTFLSPQLALTFTPRDGLMGYAAFSQGLELGGTAGVTAANAGRALDPKIARQVELGVKSDLSARLLATAALFHIWKPYEFTGPDNVFVQHGIVRHSGLEIAAVGRVADRLRVVAGATLLHARQDGTGVAAFDGKAPLNVPWLRSQVTLDWDVPRLPGAALNGSWARVSEKYARRDNALTVPAYNRFDLGVRCARRAGPVKVVWRFRIENVLDTVYWKDVGEYFGDGYLHLGAPRTFKLSAQLDF
ncbi:MAG: TonB-dependent siderophore receptor [Elusimicrobia bacterium]|nr:TonB-dependent siderophore receptor [Elusimicrobiota bacterium]